jgi:enamine deaminase RidA (YjgF/YER057c/UK114 family)
LLQALFDPAAIAKSFRLLRGRADFPSCSKPQAASPPCVVAFSASFRFNRSTRLRYACVLPATQLNPLQSIADESASFEEEFIMGTEVKRIGVGPRMSQAVVHNGTVYVAGQVGNPGEDVAAQTKTILASIDSLLAEAGTDKSRLLSTTIWLADMADFPKMNAVWDAWVAPGSTPARATGQVQLADAAYRVEVIVVAALN